MESTNLNWRKSRYSSNGGGNCVEVADTSTRVLIRDTKQAGTSPVLNVSGDTWRRFMTQVKAQS